MPTNPIDSIREALSAPLGDFIAAVGRGVGEAQAALDEGSLEKTLEIYSDPDSSDEMLQVLREMGYQPTFYTIPEVKAAAKMSLTFSQTQSANSPQARRLRPKLYATPMNATVSNQYNLNVQASSQIEFTIRPIPPDELTRIRRLPNLVKKPIDDTSRTWAEIKIIGDQFGLVFRINEKIGENTQEITDLSTMSDESIFSKQIPAANSIVREGDEIILTLQNLS
ncbi:MAG: hypothetical protein AAGA77_16890 [Bacteroidota bacterium]